MTLPSDAARASDRGPDYPAGPVCEACRRTPGVRRPEIGVVLCTLCYAYLCQPVTHPGVTVPR